jgi:hypothetical protein
MSRVWLFTVAVVLGGGLFDPAAAEPTPRPRLTRLGRGWQSVAFRAGEKVLKFGRKRIEESDVMPERWDKLRKALLEHTLDVYDRLGKSPAFAAWRHVLLPTERARKFMMVQEFAHGRPYNALEPDAKPVAQQQRQALAEAAQAALPGVEIDPWNNGNVTFHRDGRIRSWLDPAGVYGFAKQWKYKQPGAEKGRGLIRQRIGERGYQKKEWMQLFRIGNGWARRVKGGDLQWGDALVVANLEQGRAWVVKYGFREVYEGRAPSAISPRRRSVAEVLGLPLEDEQSLGRGAIQHFERGRLIYDPDQPEPIRVEVDHPLPATRTAFEHSVLEPLGGGLNTTAWRVRHNLPQYAHLTVLKKIHEASAWRWRPLMDLATRAREAERIVAATARLRSDAGFTARFGDIVPETISPQPGYLLQAEARGVTYGELGQPVREQADRDIREAARMARHILPELALSSAQVNFRFDAATGKLTAWYDLLSDTQPQPSLYR